MSIINKGQGATIRIGTSPSVTALKDDLDWLTTFIQSFDCTPEIIDRLSSFLDSGLIFSTDCDFGGRVTFGTSNIKVALTCQAVDGYTEIFAAIRARDTERLVKELHG